MESCYYVVGFEIFKTIFRGKSNPGNQNYVFLLFERYEFICERVAPGNITKTDKQKC